MKKLYPPHHWTADTTYMNASTHYIGLMSGTSIDAIDVVLVDIQPTHTQLVDALNHPIPAALQKTLVDLCTPSDNEIDRLGVADRQLGEQFALAVKALLKQAKCSAKTIQAIGSHGQTLRHRPNAQPAYTLQIGDPNTISYLTGIPTVADFRRKDISAGGQGAPLAPLFHRVFFQSHDHSRVIINIGGISNISYLGKHGSVIGYDTGPGNLLMDLWVNQHQQQAYDKDGAWAASGQVIAPLLEQWLNDDYFQQPPPKSTGREQFNQHWLTTQTATLKHADPVDIQATLLALTAYSITQGVIHLDEPVDEIFVCGGGAYNTALMQRLAEQLQPLPLASTEALNMPPEWVEAAGFAWLAQQTLQAKATNMSAVTGAAKATVLGGIYWV